MFVRGVEYSSKQLSLCFAGLMSALNFNDTSIKIGADVSQLTESQVEESGKSRVSKSCTEILSYVSFCCSVIQELSLLGEECIMRKYAFQWEKQVTCITVNRWLMDRFFLEIIIGIFFPQLNLKWAHAQIIKTVFTQHSTATIHQSIQGHQATHICPKGSTNSPNSQKHQVSFMDMRWGCHKISRVSKWRQEKKTWKTCQAISCDPSVMAEEVKQVSY